MAGAEERSTVVYAAPCAASLFVLVFELLRGARDSMWFDEAGSVLNARKTMGALLELIWTHEPNMGPYYLGLWFWVRIDDGDLWIRSLSAFGTVAAIWGIWLVVGRWSNPRAAAVAVAVFALTPFVLSWSMQARGYSIAMAFTAWSLVFADRILERKGRWSSAWFGVMVGLAVATQLSTAFVFPGVVIAIWALAPTRATVRSLVMAGLVACITFAPFSVALIVAPYRAGWIPRLTPEVFAGQLTKAMSGPLWGGLIASGCVCLVVASIRGDRFRPHLIALAGSASGVVGLVLVSVFFKPMFIDRYLAGCVPLAVVAAVGGWSALWPRRSSIVAVSTVALSIVVLGFSIDRTRPFLEGYREASILIMDEARSGDAIVAIGNYPIRGLVRYLPSGTPTERLVVSGDDPPTWMIRSQDGSEFRSDRIWIVYRDVAPSPAIGDWINRTFPVVLLNQRFGDIRLQLRETDGGW